MALRFVTAKTGSAHISSADWRSLNRGLAGKGKYILNDTEGNSTGEFWVSPSSGQITIPPCSLLWSGTHIRNTTSTVLEYVPPVVDSTVNVWLYYRKNADNGIETLDYVVTVNEQPSPVLDEIEDNTLEAYTLLFSFSQVVENSSADNVKIHFEEVSSVDALNERVTEEETARKEADDDFERRISNAEKTLSFLSGGTVEFSCVSNAYPAQLGKTILSVDESLSNFKFFICLRRKRGTSNTYREVFVIPAKDGGEYIIPQMFVEDVTVTSANKVTTINTLVKIQKKTNGGFSIFHESGVTSASDYYDKLDYFTSVIGVK